MKELLEVPEKHRDDEDFVFLWNDVQEKTKLPLKPHILEIIVQNMLNIRNYQEMIDQSIKVADANSVKTYQACLHQAQQLVSKLLG